MTTYRYKGLSPDGAKLSGVIQAYNEYEAVSQLRETCSIITQIEPVRQTVRLGGSVGGFRISEKELAILCSQFSIILSSGLPIDRCVEMVAAQVRNKELQRALRLVRQDVSGGYGLAQSFEKNCPKLPQTFLETVRAGEQSGTLESCFDRMHTYYDKSAKTKAKVISTLTYPCIVLVVAAIVFAIIMIKAVPLFVETFRDLGSELPSITVALIAASDFLTGYWWTILMIIAGVWLIHMLMLRTEAGRIAIAKGKLFRSPLHRLHRMSASAQFANTMSAMLSAGLPVVRALEVTANVAGNYVFGIAVRSVRQRVEQGRRLADSMSEHPEFPPMLTEMTGVGEQSGDLEQTLSVVGGYFDNEVAVITERLLTILEPAITIVLAVLTVVLLLAVYLPMFSMYGSIG